MDVYVTHVRHDVSGRVFGCSARMCRAALECAPTPTGEATTKASVYHTVVHSMR